MAQTLRDRADVRSLTDAPVKRVRFPAEKRIRGSTLEDVKYREILKQLKADGWVVVTIRGSHRQLKHPTKPGKVTVAGRLNRDAHPKIVQSIRRQTGWSR
jgi:predicted RNA binding protein YcfA (HicA-like mRNA interferase family)